jgi:hypothetical protein
LLWWVRVLMPETERCFDLFGGGSSMGAKLGKPAPMQSFCVGAAVTGPPVYALVKPF